MFDRKVFVSKMQFNVDGTPRGPELHSSYQYNQKVLEGKDFAIGAVVLAATVVIGWFIGNKIDKSVAAANFEKEKSSEEKTNQETTENK